MNSLKNIGVVHVVIVMAVILLLASFVEPLFGFIKGLVTSWFGPDAMSWPVILAVIAIAIAVIMGIRSMMELETDPKKRYPSHAPRWFANALGIIGVTFAVLFLNSYSDPLGVRAYEDGKPRLMVEKIDDVWKYARKRDLTFVLAEECYSEEEMEDFDYANERKSTCTSEITNQQLLPVSPERDPDVGFAVWFGTIWDRIGNTVKAVKEDQPRPASPCDREIDLEDMEIGKEHARVIYLWGKRDYKIHGPSYKRWKVNLSFMDEYPIVNLPQVWANRVNVPATNVIEISSGSGYGPYTMLINASALISPDSCLAVKVWLSKPSS